MIQKFVDKYMKDKADLEKSFYIAAPEGYTEIVKAVCTILGKEENPEAYEILPDPENIVQIDHGDYQGMLLYIIPENNYQPSTYWAVKVDYGSCSSCDTLEGIKADGDWDSPPTPGQVKDYMSLALHIVQGIKEI